ncbi:MAG: NAD(P)/FAD-dependent oxidoreductase [Chitinophagaceae bacterium]
MLLTDKKVAIIGGGPGGLTLAKLLQLHQVTVKVYERDLDRNARMVGSPLDLHFESGLAALRKAGLMDAFKQHYRPGADRMLITDNQGNIRLNDHHEKPESDFGNPHFRPEIDRAPLRNMLLDALNPDTVVWNSHLLSVDKQGTGWLLRFKDGSTAYTDVVIGADGANSKIRPYLTDIRPFYTGIIMLEGLIHDTAQTVPQVHALMQGGKIMAFGKHKSLLMGSKGGGHMGFYISFKAEENTLQEYKTICSDRELLRAWFRKEYDTWGALWQELLQATEIPLIPRPIYCMPVDQSWQAQDNLTLLGDAAHLMPPFAGEGVNMAMLDALELSERLCETNHSNLKEAIAAYEMQMRQRAAKMAQESLDNGERMHSEHSLQTMLDLFESFG